MKQLLTELAEIANSHRNTLLQMLREAQDNREVDCTTAIKQLNDEINHVNSLLDQVNIQCKTNY